MKFRVQRSSSYFQLETVLSSNAQHVARSKSRTHPPLGLCDRMSANRGRPAMIRAMIRELKARARILSVQEERLQ